MKKCFSLFCIFAILFGMLSLTVGCERKEKDPYADLLDPKNPVTVNVWNYYSGQQGIQFNELVDQFNNTEGRERGIIVTSTTQSSIDVLADELLKAVNAEVGAQTLPDMAAVYPETAFILNEKDAIVPIEDYLTEAEWAEYIPSFLEVGRLAADGDIYGFPVSKSTEILVYNQTDWVDFETAKGVSIESIKTDEDMANAAKLYYEWTDSLTPDVEDGKALFCRDSRANYIFITAARLGHEIVTVNSDGTAKVDLDKETFRTIFNNYYIPYINGYYASYDKFSSGDMKTGKILASVCSSSSVSYVSTVVTESDTSSHDITLLFSKPLEVEDQTNDLYVQQGASYYVMKSTEAKQYACMQFMKWFTDAEQNLSFSVNVGYSPVKKAANTETAIREAAGENVNQKVLSTLTISADIFNNADTYASPAFDDAKELRSYLETSFNNLLTTDRAAVVAAIQNGSTRADAVANYSTDAYFDTWYNEITAYVNNLTGQ